MPFTTAAHSVSEPAAASPLVRLPGGCAAVRGRGEAARLCAHAAAWLGPLALTARMAGRLGWRGGWHASARTWAAGVRRALRMELRVEGSDRVDPAAGYVVVPLHEGFADAVALLHLPLRLRWVVRDELLAWRWVGPLLRDSGQFPVCPERGATGYRRLLRSVRAALPADESLVVFPQGSILGIETDFHAGAFHLARALGRPLLPVAVTGSHRVWEYPYTPRVRPGQRVTLRVLAPVAADEVRDTAPGVLRQRVQDALKAAALGGTMAPPRRFVPERDGWWDGYAFRIDPAFPALAARVAARRARAAGDG